MSDFTREYQLGDILYGRFDCTQLYWNTLLEERPDVFKQFMLEETARENCPKELLGFTGRTFQELSQKMRTHARSGQTHAVISYFHKGFKPEQSPAENLQNMGKVDKQIPQRFSKDKERYHQALYKSHYSPFACVQIDKDTGVAGVSKVGTYEKYLRRASKFGAINVGGLLNARVHFVLDQINMPDVLAKAQFPEKPGSTRNMVPITTSELRALFRNWQLAYKHVLFYRAQSRVQAPWEEQPDAWTQYAKQRCAKYAEVLIKQKRDDRVIKFDHLQKADELNRAADMMRRYVTGEDPWS